MRSPARDRLAKAGDGSGHVTEQHRIVRDPLGLEERAGGIRITEPTAYEHGRDRLRDAELAASSSTSANETRSTFQLPTIQPR